MFALIESGPAFKPAAGWTPKLLSVALHAGVIAAAIAATREAVVPDDPIHAPSPIVWNQPAHTARPRPSAPAPAPVTVSTQPLPIVAPTVMPADIPLPGPVTTPVDPGPGTIVTLAPGDRSPVVDVPGPGAAAIDVRFVEEAPQLVSHPAVRYPEILRQAGVQGRVLVETVLDTLGRAEPAQTRISSGVHQLLDREAMSVVLASRYRPGRVQGRAVRVRVHVPVSFTIRP